MKKAGHASQDCLPVVQGAIRRLQWIAATSRLLPSDMHPALLQARGNQL